MALKANKPSKLTKVKRALRRSGPPILRCDDCGHVWDAPEPPPKRRPECPMCGLSFDGSDPLIGQSLQQLSIYQRVKGGLLNIVYQAHDEQRDQLVALKLLRPQAIAALGGPAIVKRLLQRWRQVHHPCAPRILRTFEAEAPAGALCWTSPWIAAMPLRSRLQPSHPHLTAPQIYALMQQLCEVLQAMHELGLVHGQLRPEQLFLQQQASGYRLFLTDLGWGEALGEHFLQRHIKDEGTMRAMRFLAPEQLMPEITAVTPQADVYAAAAILFKLLTRRAPFLGRDWDELYRAHIYAPPPRLNMASPTLHFDAPLEQLMRRALAKQPHDRYPTIKAFWQAFDEIDLADAIQLRKRTAAASQRPQAPVSSYTITAPWQTYQGETPDPPATTQRAKAPEQVPDEQADGIPPDDTMFLGRKRPRDWTAATFLALLVTTLVLLWMWRACGR